MASGEQMEGTSGVIESKSVSLIGRSWMSNMTAVDVKWIANGGDG